MLTALKRIAGVVILVGVLFAAVGPGVARAQETRQAGGTAIAPADIKNAINSPTPNLANTTAYIFYTISVIMTGTFRDVDNTDFNSIFPSSAQVSVPQSLNVALARNGLVGGVAFLMGQMISNPPASFSYYAADLARHSRFGAQPAYAQGIGFGALSPILGTWNAFKNVAYYLLTIMFFITGFLILIRHKISGNVAVTVQNALPRLVITLIVITFSYAIAGLIVDLMFLAIYFIINIFSSQIFAETFSFGVGGAIAGEGTPTPQALRTIAFDTNIFTFMIHYIFGGAAWQVADAVGRMVYDAIAGILGVQEGSILSSGGLGGLFGDIIALIFVIIFAVALLISMFRVFFQLIMSYAGFILSVVLSPLLLLEGAIPGRNPWTTWLKNLFAGLLPFVVVIFMIFTALAVSGVNTRPGVGYNQQNPGESGLRLPLILAGVQAPNAFLGILAMGFMLLLPEAVKISQQAVGAKGGPFEQFGQKAIAALKQGTVAAPAAAIVGGAPVGAGLGAAYRGFGALRRGEIGAVPRAIIEGAGQGAGIGTGVVRTAITQVSRPDITKLPAQLKEIRATGVEGEEIVQKGTKVLGRFGRRFFPQPTVVRPPKQTEEPSEPTPQPPPPQTGRVWKA